MKDLVNNIDVRRVISPVSVSDNTAQVGQVIDGQMAAAVCYAIAIGSVADADATFTALLEESDASGSGFTAVDDADLIGTEALGSFQFDSDDKTRKLGYKGIKRYTRLTITPANNTGAAVMSAVAIVMPGLRPTANPTA